MIRTSRAIEIMIIGEASALLGRTIWLWSRARALSIILGVGLICLLIGHKKIRAALERNKGFLLAYAILSVTFLVIAIPLISIVSCSGEKCFGVDAGMAFSAWCLLVWGIFIRSTGLVLSAAILTEMPKNGLTARELGDRMVSLALMLPVFCVGVGLVGLALYLLWPFVFAFIGFELYM